MSENPKEWIELVGVGGGGITILAGLALWLRKFLSSSNSDVAQDRAEIDMLERLQTENRELRAALSEVTNDRNRLYREIGDMVGEVKVLSARQTEMERTITGLTSEIERLRLTLDAQRATP